MDDSLIKDTGSTIQTKLKISSFDFIILGIIVALFVFGVIEIGSATHINLGEDRYYFNSQIIWACIGLVLMLMAAFIDYHFICKFYIPIYVVNIVLLILVLVVGSGRGVTRWISFGPIGIQPSEIAKVFMIICLANLIDKKSETINNIGVLSVVFLLAIVPVLLIQKQPSLSASMVIVIIIISQLFISKISYKYILGIFAVAIPVGIFFFVDIQREHPIFVSLFLQDYQINRILDMLNPDRSVNTYYQTMQSIKAMASGQLDGKGLYRGTLNQLSYLPEPHNDFIFSVIGEEFGFKGCIIVLSLILILVARCMIIAKNASDFLGKLIASSVAAMIAFQTFVNVGVASGLLPNTGMPLPFVSYGGSSLLTNMISVGLVLNIGMRKPRSFLEGV